MSGCVECGQDITWAEDETGKRIPLDARATSLDGKRYIFVAFNPHKVKPVNPSYIGYGYGDHRETCPAKARRRERV